MRYFLLFLLWFFIPINAALPLKVPHETDVQALIKELDQDLTQELAEGNFVGCAVAVVHENQVLFCKTYGVRKKGQKETIDKNTIFQLGSVSKPLAATLVHILHEKGIVRTHDLLKEKYPFLHNTTQLHHLLSHTSGYKRTGFNQKIESPLSKNEIVSHLASTQQEHPGESFDYHNLAFSLLEEYLEYKTDKEFPALLKEYLLMPLGMNHTSVGKDAYFSLANKAWPHSATNKKKHVLLVPCKEPSYRYHEKVPSAGGINSSITDMIQFLKLHLHPDPQLLSKIQIETMQKSYIEAWDAQYFMKNLPPRVKHYYGHGWRILEFPSGFRVIYHGGYLRGIGNLVGFIPHKHIGIILLNNSESQAPKKIAMHFLKSFNKGHLLLKKASV